jgi:hypothetical protein
MILNPLDFVYLYSYRALLVSTRSKASAENSAIFVVALYPLMHGIGLAILFEVIFHIRIFEFVGKTGMLIVVLLLIAGSFIHYETRGRGKFLIDRSAAGMSSRSAPWIGLFVLLEVFSFPILCAMYVIAFFGNGHARF